MKQRIFVCSWFPFKGYSAITLYPFIIVRKDYMEKYADTDRLQTTLNHEKIHLAQQKEVGPFRFYYMYLHYYFAGLIKWKNHVRAYMDIPFEEEAYYNDQNLDYLVDRPSYAWKLYT